MPKIIAEKIIMNRLRQRYQETVIPDLMKQLAIPHALAVPGIDKIVLSISFRERERQKDALTSASTWLSVITGQIPAVTRAHHSIAGFGIRAGEEIGLKVTLRGERMWDFLDKLLTAALPRIKDFHGVPSSSFDGAGNYTLGIQEQLIFPEIDYDSIDKIRGLQITIVTTTAVDDISRHLLLALGMPFEKKDNHGKEK